MNDHAIAIDIGGSHAKYGIVHENKMVAAKTIPVLAPTLKALLPRLETAIPALVSDCGLELRKMLGVAVGICAIVDGTGKVQAANGKYDDGVGFNIARWSEGMFGLPCKVENDTRLAMLGEHFAGAAQGFEDAVLVTLGTGIGGAVMLGGKLLQSSGHKAGGLAGHLGVAWNGRICSCGNRGCAEAEASTASLNAICREREGFRTSSMSNVKNAIDFRTLFEAVDAGDALAHAVLDHCVGIWSALSVSLIHAYDPQVIVFGGGVMSRHEVILPRIREHVDQYAWVEKGSVKIVPSSLGSNMALLGAIPLLRGQE